VAFLRVPQRRPQVVDASRKASAGKVEILSLWDEFEAPSDLKTSTQDADA
jgi:hypothetical protein